MVRCSAQWHRQAEPHKRWQHRVEQCGVFEHELVRDPARTRVVHGEPALHAQQIVGPVVEHPLRPAQLVGLGIVLRVVDHDERAMRLAQGIVERLGLGARRDIGDHEDTHMRRQRYGAQRRLCFCIDALGHDQDIELGDGIVEAAQRFYQARHDLGFPEQGHDHGVHRQRGVRQWLCPTQTRQPHHHGGKVIGVIPHYLRHQEIAYEAADELIVTKDLRERKAVMESRTDAFVALPGGFGTLEEILEVLTLKQLQQHTKPVVFLNTDGFYDPLIELFERLFRERFTKAEYREFYHVAKTPAQVFDHLKDYQPVKHTGKWF